MLFVTSQLISKRDAHQDQNKANSAVFTIHTWTLLCVLYIDLGPALINWFFLPYWVFNFDLALTHMKDQKTCKTKTNDFHKDAKLITLSSLNKDSQIDTWFWF